MKVNVYFQKMALAFHWNPISTIDRIRFRVTFKQIYNTLENKEFGLHKDTGKSQKLRIPWLASTIDLLVLW